MNWKAAVIVSTYNQPVWLEKVLWGYAAQSTDDFEVVVADDGSDQRTRAVLARAEQDFGSRLQHVWQEDRGFRKCEILNRAIVAARADYLIFSDGDCIPRRDFVATHLTLARPRRFLSGGVIWLPRGLSEAMTRSDVESGRAADPNWLRRHGWRAGRHALRLRESRLAGWLDRLTLTRASFNGHNASVARAAVLAVNGFDAEMGYGGLDRGLGERLQNLGLRGLQVRHRAVCLHLDHDRPYRRPDVQQRNREIRSRIRSNAETRARIGIAELNLPVETHT